MTFAPYNTMPKKEVERHLAMMSPPDMYVVQTAIYLRANILTRDGPQTQMASYADIKCYHVPRHL
jgi:hypothetical protein